MCIRELSQQNCHFKIQKGTGCIQDRKASSTQKDVSDLKITHAIILVLLVMSWSVICGPLQPLIPLSPPRSPFIWVFPLLQFLNLSLFKGCSIISTLLLRRQKSGSLSPWHTNFIEPPNDFMTESPAHVKSSQDWQHKGCTDGKFRNKKTKKKKHEGEWYGNLAEKWCLNNSVSEWKERWWMRETRSFPQIKEK